LGGLLGERERTVWRIEAHWAGRRVREGEGGKEGGRSVCETGESVEFVPVLGFLTNTRSARRGKILAETKLLYNSIQSFFKSRFNTNILSPSPAELSSSGIKFVTASGNVRPPARTMYISSPSPT
jgi:hypothetical protein